MEGKRLEVDLRFVFTAHDAPPDEGGSGREIPEILEEARSWVHEINQSINGRSVFFFKIREKTQAFARN